MNPDAAQSEVEHLLRVYDSMSGKAPDGEPKLQVRLGLQPHWLRGTCSRQGAGVLCQVADKCISFHMYFEASVLM